MCRGCGSVAKKLRKKSPRAIKYTGKFSLFSISESAAADIIEYHNQQHQMKCVIFRLPSVYGFGHHQAFLVDGKSIKTGLGVFIERASTGNPIEIWGDKDTGRDVIYVKDVVSAVMLAIKTENAGISGTFNIASGRILTLQDQVDSIVRCSPLVDVRRRLYIVRKSRIQLKLVSTTSVKPKKFSVGNLDIPLKKCWRTTKSRWSAESYFFCLIGNLEWSLRNRRALTLAQPRRGHRASNINGGNT